MPTVEKTIQPGRTLQEQHREEKMPIETKPIARKKNLYLNIVSYASIASRTVDAHNTNRLISTGSASNNENK